MYAAVQQEEIAACIHIFMKTFNLNAGMSRSMRNNFELLIQGYIRTQQENES